MAVKRVYQFKISLNDDEEYESMVSWCDGVFDPKKFSTKIRFADPQKRLKMILGE